MIKNIFITAAAIFSLPLAASVAPEKKFDKERYNLIKNAVDTTGWFKPEFQKQADDISIVEAHIKDIEAQINQKQSISAHIIPTMLNLLGWGSFITAGVGAIATLAGTTLGYSLLKNPNPTDLTEKYEGYSYPEYLKFLYFKMLPTRLGITPYSLSPQEADTAGSTEEYIRSLPYWQNEGVGMGLFAPFIGSGSIALYGIAKLLWNKTRSYQKEIDDLKTELALAKHLLNLLKTYGAKTIILK